jgi:hypothetical protein
MIYEYGTTVEWYWQGKNQQLGEKTCPSTTLFTVNPTRTDPDENPVIRERPETNHLSHEVTNPVDWRKGSCSDENKGREPQLLCTYGWINFK